jgi:hypothetical protein
MTKLKEAEKSEEIPVSILIPKSRKELAKEALNKFIEEETKLVKGRFRCFETPGASQKIQVLKYPGIPMFSKVMMDGEMYEIPLYVARFLNGIDVTATAIGGKVNTCSYPIHGFKSIGNELPASYEGSGPNGEGGIPVPMIGVVKRVRRYGFESLEFDAVQ